MASNTELEMRWIDAWNDLYDRLEGRSNAPCLLPDGQIVDVEACKGWLQESAYQDYYIKVEAGYVAGKKGIHASRWRVGS